MANFRYLAKMFIKMTRVNNLKNSHEGRKNSQRMEVNWGK